MVHCPKYKPTFILLALPHPMALLTSSGCPSVFGTPAISPSDSSIENINLISSLSSSEHFFGIISYHLHPRVSRYIRIIHCLLISSAPPLYCLLPRAWHKVMLHQQREGRELNNWPKVRKFHSQVLRQLARNADS